jgi:hypothetical protein
MSAAPGQPARPANEYPFGALGNRVDCKPGRRHSVRPSESEKGTYGPRDEAAMVQELSSRSIFDGCCFTLRVLSVVSVERSPGLGYGG